jgi:hypothetical protein
MALVKDTLLQQSTDMADVKDRIGKQGIIILEMQNEFRMALSDILSQIKILSDGRNTPPPPLQVNTGLPGYKNDIITRKVALQARRGYQDPC